MAGRIDIFKLSRKIHLISSMIILSFLMMYIFTGIISINRDLFKDNPEQVLIDTVFLDKPIALSPKDLQIYFRQEYNLKGRDEFREDWKKNWIFNYNFPGERYMLTLLPSKDILVIEKYVVKRTFFYVANNMHVLRGFKGGLPYTLWAIMYDLSCLAMLLFAISGIIIWFRIRKNYKSGVWYLLAGLALPLTIVLLFLYSG